MNKSAKAVLGALVAALLVAAIIIGALAYSEHREEQAAQERIAQQEQRKRELHAKMETTAVETCTDRVKNWAKYPAATEFPNEMHPIVSNADRGQGQGATSYYVLILGDALFSNAFGVPVEYDYGCVTYFDRHGEHVPPGQYDVRKKGLASGFGYDEVDDELF